MYIIFYARHAEKNHALKGWIPCHDTRLGLVSRAWSCSSCMALDANMHDLLQTSIFPFTIQGLQTQPWFLGGRADSTSKIKYTHNISHLKKLVLHIPPCAVAWCVMTFWMTGCLTHIISISGSQPATLSLIPCECDLSSTVSRSQQLCGWSS
jgi:hypothetical protein